MIETCCRLVATSDSWASPCCSPLNPSKLWRTKRIVSPSHHGPVSLTWDSCGTTYNLEKLGRYQHCCARSRHRSRSAVADPSHASLGGTEHLRVLASKLTCCSVTAFPATPAAAGEQTRITWVLKDSSYSRDRHRKTKTTESRYQLCWSALPNPAHINAKGVPVPAISDTEAPCTLLPSPQDIALAHAPFSPCNFARVP